MKDAKKTAYKPPLPVPQFFNPAENCQVTFDYLNVIAYICMANGSLFRFVFIFPVFLRAAGLSRRFRVLHCVQALITLTFFR